jgi:hypothetical protein
MHAENFMALHPRGGTKREEGKNSWREKKNARLGMFAEGAHNKARSVNV